MVGPSAHVDTFTREHLPPESSWPDFNYSGFDYPERINVGVELTDRMVERGLVAETPLNHPVRQLGGHVDPLRVVEAVVEELRPLPRRRHVIAREGVEMSRGPKHHCPPKVCRAITIFCTSEAPS